MIETLLDPVLSSTFLYATIAVPFANLVILGLRRNAARHRLPTGTPELPAVLRRSPGARPRKRSPVLAACTSSLQQLLEQWHKSRSNTHTLAGHAHSLMYFTSGLLCTSEGSSTKLTVRDSEAACSSLSLLQTITRWLDPQAQRAAGQKSVNRSCHSVSGF